MTFISQFQVENLIISVIGQDVVHEVHETFDRGGHFTSARCLVSGEEEWFSPEITDSGFHLSEDHFVFSRTQTIVDLKNVIKPFGSVQENFQMLVIHSITWRYFTEKIIIVLDGTFFTSKFVLEIVDYPSVKKGIPLSDWNTTPNFRFGFVENFKKSLQFLLPGSTTCVNSCNELISPLWISFWNSGENIDSSDTWSFMLGL